MKNSINLFFVKRKEIRRCGKKLLEQKRDDEDYRSSVISHDIWTNSFETSVPVRRIYDHVHSFLDVCDISDDKAVFGGKTVFLLNEDEAKTFYLFGGEAHFAKGTAYKDENGIICESANGFIDNIKIEPNDMTNRLLKCVQSFPPVYCIFFRFMATKLSLTQLFTWDKPL